MKDDDMTSDTEPDFALDPELHAFVDGKLPPERMAAVEARLAADPVLRGAVEGWAGDRELIREASAAADVRPTDLRTELLARELARRVRNQRLRRAIMGPALRQIAASVVIFAAGWGGHALYVSGAGPGQDDSPRYVLQTAMLHNALAAHDVEIVDVSADRMQASLDWISEQMQRKIESPGLEDMGLRVVSGRLVQGADGPLAKFTYDAGDSRQITVTMSPHPVDEPDYPFQVRSVSGRSVAYWTKDGVDYAVTGEDDVARLVSLARSFE